LDSLYLKADHCHFCHFNKNNLTILCQTPSNQINNHNSPNSINKIDVSVEKEGHGVWFRWLIGIIVAILVGLLGVFYKIDNNSMKDTQINNNNSPYSINTISQTGDNTINIGDQPRVLDDQFKESLLLEMNNLVSEKQRPISVGIVDGAGGDSLSLVEQIKSFLLDSGFELTDGMTTYTPSNPVFGIKINIVDPNKIAIMVGPKEI